jgi:Arc/MetJ-type ribon-helix-helix transcriptional regulator
MGRQPTSKRVWQKQGRASDRGIAEDYLRQISVYVPRQLLRLMDTQCYLKRQNKSELVRSCIDLMVHDLETGSLDLDSTYVREQMSVLAQDMALYNTYVFSGVLSLLDEIAHTYVLSRSDLIRYAIARHLKRVPGSGLASDDKPFERGGQPTDGYNPTANPDQTEAKQLANELVEQSIELITKSGKTNKEIKGGGTK